MKCLDDDTVTYPCNEHDRTGNRVQEVSGFPFRLAPAVPICCVNRQASPNLYVSVGKGGAPVVWVPCFKEI